jgi:hypothetical protein
MSKREKPVEIINPPNMLKVKVGGKLPPADAAMIERATRAVDNLKCEFADWLGEEITKLEACLVEVRKEGLDSPVGEMLFTTAHDLRGLGSTYEFPIITRMAGSLSKLLDSEEKRADAPLSLIEAHVGAIRAAVVQNVRTEQDPVGRALAEELEKQVVNLVGDAA